jgi:glycosyltransferase involved in cell wall biosynthesis
MPRTRVKAIFNAESNVGTLKQWNLGLSHARGEYVWFAVTDDYADRSLLETLVDRLDRQPSGLTLSCTNRRMHR